MSGPRFLPQRHRLLIALIYLCGLFVVGLWAARWSVPSFGIGGLWFYSGAAAIVLGEFILEPFFTRPADAIANGTALILAASSVSVDGAAVSKRLAEAGRIGFIAYALAVLALGVIAIWLKDAKRPGEGISRTVYEAVGFFGRARWLFGALYLAAVYAAFANDPPRIAVLYIVWIVIFSFQPLERLARTDHRRETRQAAGGQVEDVEDPRVVLARLPEGAHPTLGQRATVAGSGGTIVDVVAITPAPLVRITLDHLVPIRVGAPVSISDSVDGDIVGHVSEGTSIEELTVAASPAASGRGVEEAKLVHTRLADLDVLYQVTSATIKTKTDADTTRDIVEFQARKLGVWDDRTHGFDPVAWVPEPGAPVSVFSEVKDAFDALSIGHVPETRYGVQLELGPAVTHNTAILGILGSGKTHLAWEIMKRLLLDGVKVVVLDITDRYAAQFAALNDPPETVTATFEKRIEAAIAGMREELTVRDNESGNLPEFRAEVAAALRNFYDSECRLLILNPLHFDVTQKEGSINFRTEKPLGLSRLTMVEITRVIAEALLTIAMEEDAKETNTDEEARICLVLEEAHSLVPEWNAAVADAEKWAVNGSIRAILQGRKYGFGCLLITQRTASVTKNILNQCNTIFALRAYDATGAGFLENYVGGTYAKLLAVLKERHAVVFGRALSCAAPLIVRLNDAKRFDADVWQPRVGEIPRCDASTLTAGGSEPESQNDSPRDDDIPF